MTPERRREFRARCEQLRTRRMDARILQLSQMPSHLAKKAKVIINGAEIGRVEQTLKEAIDEINSNYFLTSYDKKKDNG